MQTRTERAGRPTVDWFDESYVLRDADGDKIGDIIEINPDFIVAESDGGFLGLGEHRRYFVPRSAVNGQDGNDWFLSIDKDQIEEMSWTAAPTGSAFATEGWRQQYGYDDDELEGGAPWYLGEVQTGVAGTDAAPAGASAGPVAGGQEVPGRMRMIRFEEDLQAQTVERQAGEVTIRKDVVEEVQTIDVPVRREEVRVERRPVSGEAVASGEDGAPDYAGAEQPFTGGSETISVPVMEERVEVRKVARPVEEVVVTKDATQETRRVSETVRREEFDIQGDEGLTERSGDEVLGRQHR